TKLCLDELARLAFPDQTTLRMEAARGNLKLFRLGKKLYSSLAEIDRMVEKCAHLRLYLRRRSGREPSATDHMKSAQSALKINIAKLKKSSRTSLPQNTNQISATVNC